MMIVSLQNIPKNLENLRKYENWKCEYLLIHATNVSVWFTTTFYECFKSLRGYMMIVSLQNIPKNLENFRKKGITENENIH